MDRLLRAVRQLSAAQRTFAVIGVAALVLGAVALGGWLSKPSLAPLFSGLSGADASAVVDQLEADGVTYQLADGGSTVLVPQAALYGERIKLAAAGLPSGAQGDGYSLLDEMPMTSSEFQQQTTYQRAVEGELARTVEAIDGVDQASVKLAMPRDTVFAEAQDDPTASVFVSTRRGVALSPEQVQAIVHLVSAGIPGMDTADVSVVDAGGRVLSAVGAAGGLGEQRTAEYETRVRDALQGVLDQVVGRGRSAVTVTAELDFDETHRTTESFTPAEGTPPLTSSTATETYTGAGAGTATGVLGPDNVQVPSGGDGDNTYSSETSELQNAVDKSTEVTQTAPGRVERQSVAVLVDAGAAASLDMAALTKTLSAAAGVLPERGDTIEVQALVFDTSAADEAQAALDAAQAQEDAAQAASDRKLLIGAGAGLLVALVLVLLAVRAGRRRRNLRERREALDLGDLAMVQGGPAPLLLDAPDDLPALPVAAAPLDGPDPVERKRAEIAELADAQPEEVAELLRGWLTGAGPRGGR